MRDGETRPAQPQAEQPSDGAAPPESSHAQPQTPEPSGGGTAPPAPAPSSEKPAPRRGKAVWELAAAALAVLLYVLLADAVVETILTRSPLQWIVLGTVVAYFILSAALWRSLSWSARAAASILLVMALAAGTAWLPGGLTQGLALFRQPTSTVLAGLTGVAILLGIAIPVRWRFVPLWGRAALGLIALYGLAAVGLGVVNRVPYAALLHGRSEWQRLPFWLQGAFLGAVLLTPAMFLANFIYGLIRVRGRALRVWGLETIVLALATVIAAAGVVGTPIQGFVPGPGPVPAPSPIPPSPAPAPSPVTPGPGPAPAPSPIPPGPSPTPPPVPPGPSPTPAPSPVPPGPSPAPAPSPVPPGPSPAPAPSPVPPGPGPAPTPSPGTPGLGPCPGTVTTSTGPATPIAQPGTPGQAPATGPGPGATQPGSPSPSGPAQPQAAAPTGPAPSPKPRTIDFSTVFVDPHPLMSYSGTIGFAYAGDMFVGTVQSDGKGSILYSTDLNGKHVAVFAPTIFIPPNPFSEHFVASSLGLGGFPDRDIYVAGGNSVIRINHAGTSGSTFVGGLNGAVRGILFDAVGTFGNDMLITTNDGHVYRVDSAGKKTLLASVGEDTEGLDVAPTGPGAHFGPYNGQLIVASEGSGKLRAISCEGTVTELPLKGAVQGGVIPGLPEELTFVPLNLGASGDPVEGFYGSDYGPNVIKVPASAFSGLQGDIILTLEGSHVVMLVHFDPADGKFAVSPLGKFPGQPEDGIFVTPAIVKGAPKRIAQVIEEQGRIRIVLPAAILFDFDKYDLKPSAEAGLTEAKGIIDQHPGAHVIIEGHTDDRGTQEYNLTLSAHRAQSVAQWLRRHGFQASRLETHGYGKIRPRYPNTTEENRHKNRRVEIIVVK